MADVRTQLFSLQHLMAVNYFTQKYNTDSEDYKSHLGSLASMVEVVSAFLEHHTATSDTESVASNSSYFMFEEVSTEEKISLNTKDEAFASMDNISSEADEIISIIQEWDVSPTSLMTSSTTWGASATRGSDNTITISSDVSQISSSTIGSKTNAGRTEDPFINTMLGLFKKIAPSSRYKPKHLRRKKFSIVPYEFASMWRSLPNLYTEKETSIQEIIRPRVAWHKVNPGALQRFPRPDMFPIMSVSPRPSFYGKSCNCATNLVSELGTSVLRTVQMLERRLPPQLCLCPTEFEKENPFGSLPGFKTNLGVVPIPDTPLFGHVWDHEASTWVLHAEIHSSRSSQGSEVDQNQGFKDQSFLERRRTRGRPRRRG